MLQQIRERSQGLVMGVIVFFICLTFALFGVQQYLDAQSSVVVAEVNGDEVPLTEFQRAFTQLRQRAQAMFGDSEKYETYAVNMLQTAEDPNLSQEQKLAQMKAVSSS